MAHSPSPEPVRPEPLDRDARDLLIDLADRAIVDGLDGRRPGLPDPGDLPDALRRPLGSFVTLEVDGELNGCIGSVETDEPLGVGVARHAWSAAFEDPRLPPLQPDDCERLAIDVSVLSPLVPVPAPSRVELTEALRPGDDGLLIDGLRRRAVFLPSVWRSLPQPEDFVAELFAKAGLDVSRWPDDLRAWRFTTIKVQGGRRDGPATAR